MLIFLGGNAIKSSLTFLHSLRQLKVTRSRFVTLVSNHTSPAEEVKESALAYLSFLRGLISPPAEAAASSESKLRTVTTFKWTNSMGGKTPSVQADAQFEVISILVNLALWYTKYAARLSANERSAAFLCSCMVARVNIPFKTLP